MSFPAQALLPPRTATEHSETVCIWENSRPRAEFSLTLQSAVGRHGKTARLSRLATKKDTGSLLRAESAQLCPRAAPSSFPGPTSFTKITDTFSFHEVKDET